MTSLPLPAWIVAERDAACAACKTPCALKASHLDSCAACPLPEPCWGAWNCHRLGDRVAAEIKTRILDRARPYAPAIVAAVENCGGCREARRHLNDGKLDGEGAPPPAV